MTDDTPAWMTERALAIAVEHTSDPHDQHRLQRDVLTAMQEAAREVALFFAANPEQIQEVPAQLEILRRGVVRLFTAKEKYDAALLQLQAGAGNAVDYEVCKRMAYRAQNEVDESEHALQVLVGVRHA